MGFFDFFKRLGGAEYLYKGAKDQEIIPLDYNAASKPGKLYDGKNNLETVQSGALFPAKSKNDILPLPSTGDYLLDSAIENIFEMGQASVSMLQRRLKIGYGQAAKLVDEMEGMGIVSSFHENVPRKILVTRDQCAPLIEQENLKKEMDKLIKSVGFEPNLQLSKCDPMEVIVYMEKNIATRYKYFILNAYTPEDGAKILSRFQDNCNSSNLPLAANVRLESLVEEYSEKFSVSSPLCTVDQMEGHEFEHWCAELLKKNGFENVEVTQASGDQGVDIIAVKDGVRYAIQCKRYSSDLGNGPVQEVHAGKNLYHCHVGVVMTNRHFTSGAKELAEATGVLLWGRDKLEEMLSAL